jgi:succinoglycan biosynthesis protein ExoA
MDVTLIIPCRNEVAMIQACIESILNQDPLGKDWELLVIDGASTDGTREVLDRMAATQPRLRVLNNPHRIAAAGLNIGILQARGDRILRLDAHTHYARDYVRQCLHTLETTGADNVGGPWVARGSALISRAIAAAFQSPLAIGGALCHDPHYEGPVDTVYLGCWRRSAFERFGLFDDSLVRNQDDEHNLRITRAGGRVWQNPKIRSWYQPRGSLRALFRQYRQYGYWKVRVIQKHRLPASWRHLVPGLFVLALSLLTLATFLSSVTPLPLTWAPRLLLAALSFYSCAVVVAALLTARRTEWKLLLVLPAVFPCFHFGYGFGFCQGFLDFVLGRRRPADSQTQLTRPAQIKTP